MSCGSFSLKEENADASVCHEVTTGNKLPNTTTKGCRPLMQQLQILEGRARDKDTCAPGALLGKAVLISWTLLANFLHRFLPANPNEDFI